MGTKISYSKCSLFVQGMDMNCPMCGALVKSGESHECHGAPPAKKATPKKKAKAQR